jgi:hypothetical protein
MSRPNRPSALVTLSLSVLCLATFTTPAATDTKQWSVEKANEWYAKQPWLVGANYGPRTAINQLEMWQADTFDLETIDEELGWAERLGFNSKRVFLHHLLWEQDKDGFLKRLGQFLDVAEKHKITVMFVLFDSVWDPNPRLGRQRAPKPHLHNSGWVQSPGKKDLLDRNRWGLLEAYVKGVVGHFKNDRRVVVWDVFNEPDNANDNNYGHLRMKEEPDKDLKIKLSLELLKKSYEWARSVDPSQPLTSGVWQRDWADESKLTEMDRFQLEASDVVSFHTYDPLDEVKRRVAALRRYKRPLLCTEYMARPRGSTFDPILAYFKQEKIAAYNWGFVAGKTQTIYPWETWRQSGTAEPKVWFHDIFRADGKPFDPKEVEYIRRVTGARQK